MQVYLKSSTSRATVFASAESERELVPVVDLSTGDLSAPPLTIGYLAEKMCRALDLAPTRAEAVRHDAVVCIGNDTVERLKTGASVHIGGVTLIPGSDLLPDDAAMASVAPLPKVDDGCWGLSSDHYVYRDRPSMTGTRINRDMRVDDYRQIAAMAMRLAAEVEAGQ